MIWNKNKKKHYRKSKSMYIFGILFILDLKKRWNFKDNVHIRDHRFVPYMVQFVALFRHISWFYPPRIWHLSDWWTNLIGFCSLPGDWNSLNNNPKLHDIPAKMYGLLTGLKRNVGCCRCLGRKHLSVWPILNAFYLLLPIIGPNWEQYLLEFNVWFIGRNS